MKIIELDLTGCVSLFEIHERIRVAFDFPEWYGKNWDAFWDLLWSECDADKVIVKGTKSLSQDFEKHIAIMCKILEKEVSFRNNDYLYPFSYEIVS